MKVAESVANIREFMEAARGNKVIVRVGGEAYEGVFHTVLIGSLLSQYRDRQQIAIPVVVGDDFLVRNRLLLTAPGVPGPFTVTQGTASLTVRGRKLEFDFTRLGRYSEDAVTLWLAAGASIHNRGSGLTVFLAHIYNFRSDYPPEVMRDVAMGLIALSLTPTNYLQRLMATFKTEVFKSFTWDVMCIKSERRLCPPPPSWGVRDNNQIGNTPGVGF